LQYCPSSAQLASFGAFTQLSLTSSQVSSVQPTPSPQSTTVPIVRRVVAAVARFITAVHRTGHVIITVNHRSCLADACSIAYLFPVTVETIVTVRIRQTLYTGIQTIIAQTACARVAAGLAAADRVTGLCPVTESSVVAERIIRGVVALIIHLITAVYSTGYAVVTIRGSTGLAAADRVTGLCPVTESFVVAERIVRRVVTLIIHLITAVYSTGYAVVTVNRCAGLARPRRTVTVLHSVTVKTIVTVRICQALYTGIQTVIAQTACARVTTGLTVIDRVTGLYPVTESFVVAVSIVRYVDHDIICFVTAVVSTAYPVVDDRGYAGLAVVDRVTGFYSVTEISVVAERIIRGVVAAVICFITGIQSAGYVVIAVRRRTELTTIVYVTAFLSVTPLPVITDRRYAQYTYCISSGIIICLTIQISSVAVYIAT
jgi:hypothetical protein